MIIIIFIAWGMKVDWLNAKVLFLVQWTGNTRMDEKFWLEMVLKSCDIGMIKHSITLYLKMTS